MPQILRSPLSEQDMNALEALAAKANAHAQVERYTPVYVALDVGDAKQRDGYLFLCWPALNSRSSHCAQLVFAYIADVIMAEFGATMVSTTPQGAPDVNAH